MCFKICRHFLVDTFLNWKIVRLTTICNIPKWIIFASIGLISYRVRSYCVQVIKSTIGLGSYRVRSYCVQVMKLTITEFISHSHCSATTNNEHYTIQLQQAMSTYKQKLINNLITQKLNRFTSNYHVKY